MSAEDKGKETVAKPAWDTERQLKDELRSANASKAALTEKLDAIDAKLDAITSKPKELDLDDYDGLKQAVVGMQAQQKDLIGKLTDAQTAQKEAEQKLSAEIGRINQQTSTRTGQQMLDTVCGKLDKEYGAEHREKAVAVVDAIFVEKKINLLDDDTRREWIETKLDKTYRDLRDEAKANPDDKSAKPKEDVKETKKTAAASTIVDTGVGGASPSTEIKEGSVKEVAAQVRANLAKGVS